MTELKGMHPPYDFGWKLRDPSEADVVVTQLGDGRLEITINHQILPGVTTEMVEWWFQNFDGVAQYGDRQLPAYHLWHPRDHIAVGFSRGKNGRVSPGQTIHIHEAFQRDASYEIKNTATIHRWDRRGVGFHQDAFMHRVFELDHLFTDTPNGLDYRSRSRVGAPTGPLRYFINKFLVPRIFSEEKQRAWIKHNVEEVGCFANFLPELYAKRAISHPAKASKM